MNKLLDFILHYKLFGIASPSLGRIPTWEDYKKYYIGNRTWKGDFDKEK